jgi:hypothetical protein
VKTTIESYHDFFVASAGVAGALIGLLFVALSVAPEPTDEHAAFAHRVRASGALTAFSNALTVSLFALIPDVGVGWPALSVAVVGAGYVIRSLHERLTTDAAQGTSWRDLTFVGGISIIFAFQAEAGVRLIAHGDDAGALQTVGILVVVCFLFGVGRAWEMIGGPKMGSSR